MSDAPIDLLVSKVMTRRPHEGTRTFQVRLASVAADTVTFSEVALGDDRELAAALDVEADRVTIRATTTDKLGFTGRGEGLAAQAVALLRKRDNIVP